MALVVASVGSGRCWRYVPVATQLATGGIQRVLLRFADARPHQRSAVTFDEFAQGVLGRVLGERIVAVTAPDEFAAERAEVVAMPADGGLGQTLVQQVQDKRHERLDDLLAHGDVRGLDVPRSWPVIEVRDGLAKTLCVLRIAG